METNDLFQKLIENLYDGIYFVDTEKRIILWNRAAERITGFSRNEVTGIKCSANILRHIDAAGTELCLEGCPLSATLVDGQIREADVYLHHREGHRVPVSIRVSPVRNDSGEIVGAVEIFTDNSSRMEILKELQELKHDVYIDPLTGVGNRKFGQMNTTRMMTDYRDHRIPFGIIMIDVDHFKAFNDTWGHPLGDRILVMVAKSTATATRKLDIVSRWGGEEFIILVPNVDAPTLAAIAERIRVMVEGSWLEHEGNTLRATVSVGGTMFLKDDTLESLLERADSALYTSKECGRNRVTMDEPGKV